MTEAPARRDSLLRLVWAATMPEALAFVGPFAGVLLLQAWIAWHRPDHSLNALAAGFRMPVVMFGIFLLVGAFMSDPDGRPAWVRRLRTRWKGVGTLAELDVATAAPAHEGPGAVAVALPMLTGVGAACLGVAFGLNAIVAFSHDPPWNEPRTLSLLIGLGIASVLAAAMYRVTGSTRRLYVWSQEVAASAATAQADADRARISALQAQMNPHFLFNALNTVASLLGTDGARARRTVQNLSGMLEHTLQRSAEPLTTVEEEMQFVRDYLNIERERFGPRLQVTYDVDPGTAGMTVPTMSLQPLVENAIKHAVANRLEGGHIRIAASRRGPDQGVRLVVDDDGPGFAPGSEDGTGLRNLRARLWSLYGSAAELATETLSAGARVSLTIPPSPQASAWLAPSNQS